MTSGRNSGSFLGSMDAEFLIPARPEDLESSSPNVFAVEDVVDLVDLNERDICVALDEIDSDLAQNGAHTIVTHEIFDRLYSYAGKNCLGLVPSSRGRVLELLMVHFASLIRKSVVLLDPKATAAAQLGENLLQVITTYRNALKMVVIHCDKPKDNEEESIPGVTSGGVGGKRAKRGGVKQPRHQGQPTQDEEELSNHPTSSQRHQPQKHGWQAMDYHEKEKVLRLLTSALDLNRLWDTSKPEERFLDILGKTALVLLENGDNIRQSPAVREGLILLLAGTIQKHLPRENRRVLNTTSENVDTDEMEDSPMLQNAFDSAGAAEGNQNGIPGEPENASYIVATVITPLIEVLMRREHLPKVVSDLLGKLQTEYQCEVFVTMFLRQISVVVNEEVDASEDSAAASHISTMLIELADKHPAIFWANAANAIGPNIDCPAYKIRQAVVHAIGQVLSQILHNTTGAAVDSARAAFFDMLVERLSDVSAWARGKVLSTWEKLWQGRCLPLELQPMLLEKALLRVKDKSPIVRKGAVQLLTTALQCNSYGAVLHETHFRNRMQACVKKLAARNPEVNPEELLGLISASRSSEQDANQAGEMEEGDAPLGSPRASSGARLEGFAEAKEEMTTLHLGCRFVNILHQCMEQILTILHSKSESDVLEAVAFIESAYLVRLEPSHAAMCRLATLVFYETQGSKEGRVREAVQHAYENVLLTGVATGVNNAGNSNTYPAIVRRMLKIWGMASEGEMTGLQHIIGEMAKKGLLNEPLVNAIWEVCLQSTQPAPPTIALADGAGDPSSTQMGPTVSSEANQRTDSRLGMRIFGMIAATVPDVMIRRMDAFIQLILPVGAKRDPIFGAYACMALQHLSNLSGFAEMPPTHPIVTELASLVTHRTGQLGEWTALAESALNAIYALCNNPEALARALIIRMEQRHRALWESGSVAEPQEEPRENAEKTTEPAFTPLSLAPSPNLPMSAKRAAVQNMTRLIFVVGHTCLKQMTYNELAFRKVTDSEKVAKPGRNQAAAHGAADEDDDGGSIIQQFSAAARSLAEREAEKSFKARERAMAMPTSVWVRHLPNILTICCSCDPTLITDKTKAIDPVFQDTLLRSPACLSLCKLMLINEDICDKYLRALFPILRATPEWINRANIIMCIGDFLSRFPNSAGLWANHLFRFLRDPHPYVRCTVMSIATHLILSDMLKGSAIMQHMARALDESDPRLSEMARLFYRKLAEKNKQLVYNQFPEIFSALSSDASVDKETFQHIFAFLATFIDEMHGAMLIERLCQRFPMHFILPDEEQAKPKPQAPQAPKKKSPEPVLADQDGLAAEIAGADAHKLEDKEEEQAAATQTNQAVAVNYRVELARKCAYVISLLVSGSGERCLRKLDAGFSFYAKALHDEEVYHHFAVILMKLRKFAKDTLKPAIDELETKINEERERGQSQQEMLDALAAVNAMPPPPPPKPRNSGDGNNTSMMLDSEDQQLMDRSHISETQHPSATQASQAAEEMENEGDRERKLGRQSRESGSEEPEDTRSKKHRHKHDKHRHKHRHHREEEGEEGESNETSRKRETRAAAARRREEEEEEDQDDDENDNDFDEFELPAEDGENEGADERHQSKKKKNKVKEVKPEPPAVASAEHSKKGRSKMVVVKQEPREADDEEELAGGGEGRRQKRRSSESEGRSQKRDSPPLGTLTNQISNGGHNRDEADEARNSQKRNRQAAEEEQPSRKKGRRVVIDDEE